MPRRIPFFQRNKPEFGCCWLAATTSSNIFKRYYHPNAIKKMNIEDLCEKIRKESEEKNNKTTKLNLYALSQLMYGVTKIHYYQVELFEKELFETQEMLKPTQLEKNKADFDEVADLTIPVDLPSVNPKFLDTQGVKDLHILPGENPDDRLQLIMKDATCLDFGVLTDEELHLFFDHYGDTMSMRHVTEITDNKEQDLAERMTAISIAEGGMEVCREKQSPLVIPSPRIADISKQEDKSKGEAPLTPQKRQSRHLPITAETPTKRRCLSLEDIAKDTMLQNKEEMEGLVLPQHIEHSAKEIDIELESLDSSVFVIEKRWRKKTVIDNRTVLRTELLKQRNANINIGCRPCSIPQPRKLVDLFTQPSHRPGRWAAVLQKNFTKHITGPFNTDAELIKLMQSVEAIRLGETSKPDLPAEELIELGKTHDTNLELPSLLNIQNILPFGQTSDAIHETHEVSTLALPEIETETFEEGVSVLKKTMDQATRIDDTAESILDIDNFLEEQWQSSKPKEPTPPYSSSSSTSQHIQLTKHEIMAFLQVLWEDEYNVKFTHLIPKETYTVEDAATAFRILLDLHAEKKVVLKQTDCYKTLYISKYETYSDCTSD